MKKQEAIEKILEFLNSGKFQSRMSWAMTQPSCRCYASQEHCGAWEDWCGRGRTLFAKGKDGEKAYFDKMRGTAPRIPLTYVKRCLKEYNYRRKSTIKNTPRIKRLFEMFEGVEGYVRA